MYTYLRLCDVDVWLITMVGIFYLSVLVTKVTCTLVLISYKEWYLQICMDVRRVRIRKVSSLMNCGDVGMCKEFTKRYALHDCMNCCAWEERIRLLIGAYMHGPFFTNSYTICYTQSQQNTVHYYKWCMPACCWLVKPSGVYMFIGQVIYQ